MKKTMIIMLGVFLFIGNAFSQTYPDNETGTYQDMLQPAYYLAPHGSAYRNEVNKFVHFARLMPFRHPLENGQGVITSYTTPTVGEFGAGKGLGDTLEHHSGVDMHVGSNDSNVVMYAAFSGYVHTDSNDPEFRNSLSITENVTDSLGNVLGKMVVVYGHLELSLDSLDGRILDGQYVSQGDTVSKHLYSGTLGGPHLHFEIRYYRTTDAGTETFYSYRLPPYPPSNFTDHSTGSWMYGWWDPNIGYGYANPANHLNNSTTNVSDIHSNDNINVYPNPTNGIYTLQLGNVQAEINVTVYNAMGQTIIRKKYKATNQVKMNLSGFANGLYFLEVAENSSNIYRTKIIKE